MILKYPEKNVPIWNRPFRVISVISVQLSFSQRRQPSVHHIDQDGISCMDAVGKDQLCRQGLHIFLQIPFQRSGSVNRIVAIVHDELLCLIGQGDGQLLIGQTPG